VETTEFRIPTASGHLFAQRWDASTAASPGVAPLILLHDSLGCVALWRDLPERLASATGRTVIAYDRLGFGRSDPNPGQLGPDFIHNEAREGFAALKSALGLERLTVFGHSVGGGMAVGIAAAYPEACDAIITVSAQSFLEDRTLAGIRAAQQAFAEPGQVDRLRRHHGDKAPWVLSAWINTWLSPEFAHWSLDADLPHVHCPNLVLHGRRDEYGSERHAERIAELSAGPSTLHIDDWGHVPHREAPDDVVALVAAWLAQAE
jgi:pimeloyl-ACP methyl ester carboxylesterase